MAHINRTSIPTHHTPTPPVPSASTPAPAAPPSQPHVRAPESSTMRGKLGKTPQAQGGAQAQRKAAIRAERKAREGALEDTQSALQIRTALDGIKKNADAKVLMFGYSPTGGGHTGRLLNILSESIDEKHIKSGDVVVAHVPSIWNNRERPADLSNLLSKFNQIGATVLLVEAEKSVQGYLRPDGSSNDPAILSRIATRPKRPDADLTSITQAKVFAHKDDVKQLQTIDANHLLDSLSEQLGEKHMGKVFVADDMDPALQKAADRYGVPAKQRVGQQNHAILLNPDQDQMSHNLQPNMGVLGKVLGGYGEQVAHIGLGDKNTLQAMEGTAELTGIDEESTKQEALHKVSELFLRNGNKVDVTALGTSQAGAGIMHHASLTDAGKVKNMMYVYANDNQREIALHIDAKIQAGDAHYKDTLFVFCGKGVFKPNAPANANALHMAYLADADGITTAGAGTVGEFAYLHNAGGAKGKFMAIPIEGHNEQEANATFLQNDPHLRQFVTVASNLREAPLPQRIDQFMAISHNNIGQKYSNDTLERLMDAIGDEDTYPAHGRELLFGQSGMTPQETHFAGIERAMNQDPVLSANRHMQKVVFQAIENLVPVLQGKAEEGPISIALRRSQPPKDFNNIGELAQFLGTDKALEFLSDGAPIRPTDILLLNETRDLFNKIASRELGSKATLDAIDDLQEKFGHKTTTGF